MLSRKQGFPEDSEIVICTVTKVLPHAVFARLEEYGKTGMIHISEVSPGRIRNIRDYVKEGKHVICKVLHVRKERNQIDLSLRRVSEAQKKKKAESLKQEQRAEKIIEFVTKQEKLDFKKTYAKLSDIILKKYDSVYESFEDIVTGHLSLTKLGVPAKVAKALEEVVKQRIKPPEVMIKGTMALASYESDGLDVVKNTVKAALSAGKKHATVNYLGAGKFKVIVKAPDYKKAEKVLTAVLKAAEKNIEKTKGSFHFERDE